MIRRRPGRGRTRVWPGCGALITLATLLAPGCGHDPADQLYLSALRGEEEGWSRARQIEALDRAIALEPRRSVYWQTRGGYRTDARDFAGAEADLDRAIELADRPYLRYSRGLVRCERGRFEAALADLDAAIAGQPENTQFYRGRALARIEAGLLEGALADADHLVAAVPQQAESHHARGRALEALGRPAEAIAAFDQAIRMRPELVYPLLARARCRAALGDADGARRDREEAARRAEEQSGCAPCLDPFRY